MSSPTFHGKRLTPRAAIRVYCKWCNGGNPKTCVCPACPLFGYRMGKVSTATCTSPPLRAIRARCLDCAGSANAVRDCQAFKDFSEVQTACDLWPHREGKRPVSAGYREARREQAKNQLGESGPGATFSSEKALEGAGKGVAATDNPGRAISGEMVLSTFKR